MADPKIDPLDSSQSSAEDRELNSWLWRLKTQINKTIHQVRNWMTDHIYLAPPYTQDPHVQYWHKILDPAWAHMLIESYATPIDIDKDDIITGYTRNGLDDYQLESNLTNGTITVSSTAEASEHGVYAMTLTGYMEATKNSSYVITLYANGLPTAVKMPIRFGSNQDSGAISWSGVVAITSDLVLDLRFSDGTGSSLSLFSLNWSMHRISPAAGETSIGPTAENMFLNPAPIPPDWGSHP